MRMTLKRQARGHALGNVRRVVVQVGRSLLATTAVARVRSLAIEVADLRQGGIEVLLVTSGAVHLGSQKLGLKAPPVQVPMLQAVSAVGQVDLMRTYEDALAAHGIQVAQAMITAEDLDAPRRFLRLRHTLMALLDYGVVPLMGENQAISDEELCQDQHDLLAARITRLVEADLLVLLTSAEGLYESSPLRGGKLVHLVDDINSLADRVEAKMAGRGAGAHPVAAKVLAARRAATFGVPTVVASGVRAGVLHDLLDDDMVGTLLLPPEGERSPRQWIARDRQPAGEVTVSSEAGKGIQEEQRGLQAKGVLKVSGDFSVGDAVQVLDEAGDELARGLVGFRSANLERIKGKGPEEIGSQIQTHGFTEVIRRDDLLIL